MKTATIHSSAGKRAGEFTWSWRATGEKTRGADGFKYYYECVSHARELGYHVEPLRASGAMAPGGVGFAL